MINDISSFLVGQSLASGVIGREDEDLYLYSYQSLLAQLLNWITIMTLGLLFQQFMGSVAFMLFFLPLRTFGGGHHERDYQKCYLFSLVVYLLLFYVCPWIAVRVTLEFKFLLLTICSVIIFFRVPVADKNKPLDSKERQRCKLIARAILVADAIIVSSILFVNAGNSIASFALAAIAMVAVLLIVPAAEESDAM